MEMVVSVEMLFLCDQNFFRRLVGELEGEEELVDFVERDVVGLGIGEEPPLGLYVESSHSRHSAPTGPLNITRGPELRVQRLYKKKGGPQSCGFTRWRGYTRGHVPHVVEDVLQR